MKKNLCLILILFILNLAWEIFHYRFYVDLTGIHPALHIILASFADMLLVLVVLYTSSKISGTKNILNQNYLVVLIIGLIFAGILEITNLRLGRWQYISSMPVIFGIGVSPLIQLSATAIISVELIKVIFKNNNVIHPAPFSFN
jgi:hypothetical protein